MNHSSFVTPTDYSDPRNQAAERAEKALFDYYNLDYKVNEVELDTPTLRLRILEVGKGKPVLMVPGGSGDAAMFAPLMAELPGWRFIAINRPGGGMSDGVDHRRFDLRRLAQNTIRTVADAFDLERVPIICNSMGGLWSFWYALAYPERVTSMVQMGCPALALNTSAPFFMRLMSVPIIQNLIAPNMQPNDVESSLSGLRHQGSSQEAIDSLPPVFAEGAFHFFNLPTYLDTWKTLISAVATITGANPRYSLRAEEMAQVDCPVQFIWGDNDPFGGFDVARKIVNVMPDAQLHEMQAGHLPFLDKPEETGRIINRFLTRENEQDGMRKVPA